MSDVKRLDVSKTAETGDLAVDLLELLGSGEHGDPGFGILGVGHIVIGVIAGYDHKRTEHDVLVTGGGNGLDNGFAGGLFGLALNGADKYVLVAQRVHLRLHLGIADLRGVGGAVTHEYESGARGLGFLNGDKTGVGNGGGDNGLGYGFLIGVDGGSVCAHFTEERLGNDDLFDLVGILVGGGLELVIFGAVP